MTGSRILVTGAGGYIGTRLVPELLKRGYAVRAVDRYFFGAGRLGEHERLETIRDDTRRLTEAHFRDVQAVIDLVAISNETCGQQFAEATWQINGQSRIRTAEMARQAGARLYLLPSSCSVYGVQPAQRICDETTRPNPQTVYAQANHAAEQRTLILADEQFTVVVLRQATVFGDSPRIRLDLAINFMVNRAWRTDRLPIVRDGNQWRPYVHIEDAVAAQLFMLEQADRAAINGQIYNVGANAMNYTAGALAEHIAECLPRPVEREWIGDPDARSYRINCDKIEKLGWSARYTVADGVKELWDRLESGQLDDSPQTHTLRWYRDLEYWHPIIRQVEMYGGILNIDSP